MKKFLLVTALTLASCGQLPAQSVREQQATVAARASNRADFSAGNAEVENISRRQVLVSNPGLVGYVLEMNFGRPVAYFTIKGKISSCAKRLESTETYDSYGNLTAAPSYDGTFGTTDPDCHFYFTTNGQYIQSNMDYIWSDQPLNLNGSAALVASSND